MHRKLSCLLSIGDALNDLNRDMFKQLFVLMEVCSVDILVACLRISTGFEGDSFRETSTRALWPGADKIARTTCLKD